MESHWNRIEVRSSSNPVEEKTIRNRNKHTPLLTITAAVDNVLEDCFQLISLFFLTIGRNNEAPAVSV